MDKVSQLKEAHTHSHHIHIHSLTHILTQTTYSYPHADIHKHVHHTHILTHSHIAHTWTYTGSCSHTPCTQAHSHTHSHTSHIRTPHIHTPHFHTQTPTHSVSVSDSVSVCLSLPLYSSNSAKKVKDIPIIFSYFGENTYRKGTQILTLIQSAPGDTNPRFVFKFSDCKCGGLLTVLLLP